MTPRYGRIAAFGAAVLMTAVTILGGLGVLPSGGHPTYAKAPAADRQANEGANEGAMSLAAAGEPTSAPEASVEPSLTPESDGQPGRHEGLVNAVYPVPSDSGDGRRIVFDQSSQRVWLVGGGESVKRTYLVSGSVYDNLDPGAYEVYSKSETAYGIDDSGTMEFMVRFAHGPNAAIGFHSVPVLNGELVQDRSQLGTPLSHGCVRQWRSDAKALWDFAPVGTKVVVTA